MSADLGRIPRGLNEKDSGFFDNRIEIERVSQETGLVSCPYREIPFLFWLVCIF